jgi:hypothetical protein
VGGVAVSIKLLIITAHCRLTTAGTHPVQFQLIEPASSYCIDWIQAGIAFGAKKMKAHAFCLGWAPWGQNKGKALYVRDPITHEVCKYEADTNRAIKRLPTDYISIGGLNYEGKTFNRRKGVAEYGDLTHLFHPRNDPAFANAFNRNPACFRMRSNSVTRFAEDAVLNGERNPFRVGK